MWNFCSVHVFFAGEKRDQGKKIITVKGNKMREIGLKAVRG